MPPALASTDLLVGQWRNAVNMKAMLDAFIEEMGEEVFAALNELYKNRVIVTAEGIWLDFIGERLGIDRPWASQGGIDLRWGFEGIGVGFDQRPFKGAAENDETFPLPDIVYRKILYARAISIITRGTKKDFEDAAEFFDPNVVVIDNFDMTITVVTDQSFFWQFELADKLKALPRVGGVRIILDDFKFFGFEGQGVGPGGESFDQGRFAGA